jgi:hypothetical protein
LLAAGALVVCKPPKVAPTWLVSLIVGVSLLAIVALAITAHRGGQIRRPELRAAPNADVSPG